MRERVPVSLVPGRRRLHVFIASFSRPNQMQEMIDNDLVPFLPALPD